MVSLGKSPMSPDPHLAVPVRLCGPPLSLGRCLTNAYACSGHQVLPARTAEANAGSACAAADAFISARRLRPDSSNNEASQRYSANQVVAARSRSAHGSVSRGHGVVCSRGLLGGQHADGTLAYSTLTSHGRASLRFQYDAAELVADCDAVAHLRNRHRSQALAGQVSRQVNQANDQWMYSAALFLVPRHACKWTSCSEPSSELLFVVRHGTNIHTTLHGASIALAWRQLQ